MSLARRLTLLVVAVAATMAATTASASALEVTNEPAGAHCGGAVVCSLHANATGVEIGSPLGMIICNWEFTATASTEAGAGSIGQRSLTDCSPTSWVPCAGPWSIDLRSETSMELELCHVLGGIITVNCHITLDISSTPGHAYTLQTGAGTPAPHRSCEQAGLSLSGRWVTEAGSTTLEVKD